MSIEWLLTKTTSTKTRGRPKKNDKKEAELSGTVDGSKPKTQQKATEYDDKEKKQRAEYFSGNPKNPVPFRDKPD